MPWAAVTSAAVVRQATAGSALTVADTLLRRGTLRAMQPDALAPADGVVPVRQSRRVGGSSLALTDGCVTAVTVAWLLTNTRSIRAWPRPNGLLDSRYPDGVDGFQPNMTVAPAGGGVLDSRWAFGGFPASEAIGATDGVIVALTQATGLGAVNMQIVPTSWGVLDSRYPDGLTPLLPDITAPPPPVGLDASVVGGTVTLNWPAVTDTEVPGYITSGVVQYNVRRNGSYLDSTTDLDFTDSPPDGAYTYTVRAEDAAGNVSADSEGASVNISTGPGNVLSNTQLATLGFISVTAAPYSADPSGITDATTRIQAAIDYAYDNNYAVWIPSGTYRITAPLRCYRWQRSARGSPPGNHHVIYGATYPTRPVLQLAAGAAGFQSVSAPRPMMAYLYWRSTAAASGQPVPSNLTFNPYDGPGSTWQPLSANNFLEVLHNVDLDTGRNPGAEGLVFKVAQGAYLGNVRIDATSSYCGLRGGGGRHTPAVNVEVQGGRYGVSTEGPYVGIDGNSGVVFVGLRCYDQTVANYECGGFVPDCIVGFHFTRPSGASITMGSDSGTSRQTFALIDGTIETGGGATAFVNASGKSMYMRNVYMRGTNNLIQTGTQPVVSGSGTWKRVHEYAVCDQSGSAIPWGTAPTGTNILPHYVLINGALSRTQIAANSIESSVNAPPATHVSRHIATIPSLDGDDYILLPAPTAGDSVNSINAAISSAAYAGHNRVVLRRGTYYVGDTIDMQAHTQLLGTGLNMTEVMVDDSWQPVSGNPYMVDTANDANGTAFVAHLTLMGRSLPNSYNRHNHFRWRTGRLSGTYGIAADNEYMVPNTPTPSRQVYTFEGYGGGRHYGIEKNGRYYNGVDARVVRVQSTSQPLSLYGLQAEIAKQQPAGTDPWTNVEVNGASNVRIYGGKREGSAPTVTMVDAQNVACYCGGQMLGNDMDLGYYGVRGNSDGILVACEFVNNHSATAQNYTLLEDRDSSPAIGVVWPGGVSLYKRGEIDDDAMEP